MVLLKLIYLNILIQTKKMMNAIMMSYMYDQNDSDSKLAYSLSLLTSAYV